MLVLLAVGLGVVAVLCIAAPVIAPSSYDQSDLMRPEILIAGVADLVRVPAISLALLAAIGALFVRALSWRPKAVSPARSGRLSAQRGL